jgi:translation initiation factor 4A
VRELAKQIFDVLKGIGQFLNIEFFCCIGGTSMQETKEKCKKGVHVIVATPGISSSLTFRPTDRYDP